MTDEYTNDIGPAIIVLFIGILGGHWLVPQAMMEKFYPVALCMILAWPTGNLLFIQIPKLWNNRTE